MFRTGLHVSILLSSFGMICTACAAREKLPEIIDPALAAKDPDFLVQGEYRGGGTWSDIAPVSAGAQVIALGGGRFTVVVTKGGLPGDGWKRGDPRFSLSGQRRRGGVMLRDGAYSGRIVGGEMTIGSDDGKTALWLERTVRHSRTEGRKPPKGAVVLFDGTTAKHFEHGVMTPGKNLMCEATTKQKFTDYTLHLEFRLSYMPTARGQHRSNSGVYLHDCYEIQVLDSFGLEGEDNECGGFYKLRRPVVNMCYPPLAWQTYDVEFVAPRYENGKRVANARVTVRQNGVVIQPEFELKQSTPGREGEGPAPRPFYLQGHGNKVEYRNIWVVETRATASMH